MVGLFSVMLWFLAAGKEPPCLSFYPMKIESSLHSAFRRMPLLVQLEKNWERTVQRLPRRLKSIPMTRKADVPDILIILANSAFHANQKNCAERAVRIHQHTNAVYVLSARFTVRIL